jgi:CysZ protein
VAEKVESHDYPGDPPGVALPTVQALAMSGRFALLIGVVNLGALLLLLIPGVNIIVFFVANAYLLGREYFELAACRFHGVAGARALRRRHGVRVFLYGLVIALLLAVPVVNLLTPLFGTVLMVHLHKRLLPIQLAEDVAAN